MIEWQPFQGGQQAWDTTAAVAGDTWGYQSWGWGEFRRRAGWTIERWQAVNASGLPIAVAQVFLRRLPGFGCLAWVPGGPVPVPGRTCKLGSLTVSLREGLERRCGRCYLRCYFMIPHEGRMAYELSRHLSKPVIPLGSGFSVQVDLDSEESVWLQGIDSKHRYSVRKSLATEGLCWHYGDADAQLRDLATLGERMRDDKGTAVSTYSFDELTLMRDLIPGAVRVLVGEMDGDAVTACLVTRTGHQAMYVNAATVGRGRAIGAAYAMVAVLRGYLRNEGVKLLDFGGIAPRSSSASGVDHFKMGFGGRVVEYLGEWETGSSLSRLAGNAAVLLSRHV